METLPFGPTIALWRQARGLTQDALARRARISRPNLSGIERGKREVTLRTIRALALGLDVRPGVLVDGAAPPELAAGPLTRPALERIADAAVGRPARLSASERRLAEALRILTRPRRRAAQGRSRPVRPSARATDRAWRLLALYPAAVGQTLVQRISDREARR
jgi:transcriptional regulator with XRE-family HTH domain